jgi:hypothetical protein
MTTPPGSGDERSPGYNYQPLPHSNGAQAIPTPMRRPPSSPALLAASAPQRGGGNLQVPSPPGSWLGAGSGHVEVTMPASLQRQASGGAGLGRLRVQALAAAQRSPRSSDAVAARKDRFIVLPDTATPQAGDQAGDEQRQEVRVTQGCDPCGNALMPVSLTDAVSPPHARLPRRCCTRAAPRG